MNTPPKMFRPSNQTQADGFFEEWCLKCAHGEVYWNPDSESPDCHILQQSQLMDVDDTCYPEEWTLDEHNQPCCKSYLRAGDEISYRCTKTKDMFA